MEICRRGVWLKILLLAFLAVLALEGFGFCFSAEVIDLSGKKYFPAVKEALAEAKESIFMAMYIVNLDPRDKHSLVYKLSQELVNARRRGLEVKIILDQNIDFTRRKAVKRKGQVEGKNEKAFYFFKGEGIDVKYDNAATYTHNKVIVIDGKIVILGSANWSRSALRRNNESSVLIESEELAQAILADFSKIDIDYEASKTSEEREPPLALYRHFMEDKDLAARMLTKHDERAFDLYLSLLKGFNGNPSGEVDFDYGEIARLMGIEEMSTNACRREINRTLRKLAGRYHLVEFKPIWGKPAQVKLLNLKKTTEAYRYPEGKYFLLPGEYWSYGWNKRLSFRAKYCYFINLYKAGLSERSPWWFASQDILSLKFNVHKDTISKGMIELRRLNIIDVEYSDIEDGYEARGPTRYKLLGLYSLKKQAEKLARLKRLYGGEKLKKAESYARVIFKENDAEVLEDIIKLIDEYGERELQLAINITAKKARDNPKRNFKYVIGILKERYKKKMMQK